MPRILLLTSLPDPSPDETAARVPSALRARDWEVRQGCIDDLVLDADGVVLDRDGARLALAEQDLIWVLGFGGAATFLDKMQLLASVPAPVRFVNRIEALLLHHAKYPMHADGEALPQPPTHASRDPRALVAVARATGGRWVLKPPAGSFGRGVFIGDAAQPDFEAAARMLTEGGRYALLQRWCAEAAVLEHRVLVAGGRIVGTYARVPREDGGAANLAGGGMAHPAAPDPARDALSLRAARILARRGIHFAGLDIAGPWVLEANIINPGGIATLQALGDEAAPQRLVDALLDAPDLSPRSPNT